MVLVRFGKIHEEYPLWNFKTSPHSLYRIPQLVVDTHIFFYMYLSFRIVDICHRYTYIYIHIVKQKIYSAHVPHLPAKIHSFFILIHPLQKLAHHQPDLSVETFGVEVGCGQTSQHLNTKNTSLSVQFVFSEQTTELIWYSYSKKNASKSKLKKAKRVQYDIAFQSFLSSF